MPSKKKSSKKGYKSKPAKKKAAKSKTPKGLINKNQRKMLDQVDY